MVSWGTVYHGLYPFIIRSQNPFTFYSSSMFPLSVDLNLTFVPKVVRGSFVFRSRETGVSDRIFWPLRFPSFSDVGHESPNTKRSYCVFGDEGTGHLRVWYCTCIRASRKYRCRVCAGKCDRRDDSRRPKSYHRCPTYTKTRESYTDRP